MHYREDMDKDRNNKKIDTIKEKHFALNEMSRETFGEFYPCYTGERFNVTKLLQECTSTISNLTEAIGDALVFAGNSILYGFPVVLR